MTNDGGGSDPHNDALHAELAEAKRIGTWLYAHLPAGAKHAH